MLKKHKKLTSIVMALAMAFSISSVAMAKGDKTPSTPLININGEGLFDATTFYENVLYQYDGVVSARTTKADYLDLDISFTSDNGIPMYSFPEGPYAPDNGGPLGTITEITVSQYIEKYVRDLNGNIVDQNYEVNQYKDEFNKKLVTTEIYTSALVTITYEPINPETGEVGAPVTYIAGELPVIVTDNAKEVMLSVKDLVILGDWGYGIYFIASHDTLNQQ